MGGDVKRSLEAVSLGETGSGLWSSEGAGLL